jgi:co-chaperonin GroES (HSP10)
MSDAGVVGTRNQLPDFYSNDSTEITYQDPALLKLRPAPNRFIVMIDSFAYKGRLIIPDKSKRSPTTGKVIAVSKEVLERGNIRVGMTVVYGMYSGTALKFKDVPVLRVLTEDEWLCEKEGTAEVENDFPQE